MIFHHRPTRGIHHPTPTVPAAALLTLNELEAREALAQHQALSRIKGTYERGRVRRAPSYAAQSFDRAAVTGEPGLGADPAGFRAAVTAHLVIYQYGTRDRAMSGNDYDGEYPECREAATPRAPYKGCSLTWSEHRRMRKLRKRAERKAHQLMVEAWERELLPKAISNYQDGV
jgi:hypothetical protein